MLFLLPDLMFPGETVATLTAAAATLILAVKEIAFRRLRPRPCSRPPRPGGN